MTLFSPHYSAFEHPGVPLGSCFLCIPGFSVCVCVCSALLGECRGRQHHTTIHYTYASVTTIHVSTHAQLSLFKHDRLVLFPSVTDTPPTIRPHWNGHLSIQSDNSATMDGMGHPVKWAWPTDYGASNGAREVWTRSGSPSLELRFIY